jgi:hypothetical protein
MSGRAKPSVPYNVARCNICKFPMDLSLVNPKHPLFPTIDHIISRANGGRDIAKNRAPAHLICNRTKAAEPMSDSLTRRCQLSVLKFYFKDPLATRLSLRIRKSCAGWAFCVFETGKVDPVHVAPTWAEAIAEIDKRITPFVDQRIQALCRKSLAKKPQHKTKKPAWAIQ